MRKVTVLLLLLIIVLTGVFVWWQHGNSAVNVQDKTEKIFVIPPGTGIREIANNLKQEGLIKDPVVFFLLVKQLGIDSKIQAGDFKLSPSMSAKQIAEALTHGSIDIWVTIQEGKRAEEIAEILEEKIPTYSPIWKEELKKHEGYLFPDTYLIPKDASADTIVSLLTDTFETRYKQIEHENKTGLTKEEIVIVASLIEREARLDEDRPLVASVMLNRLEIGMPLQIDATVQYALGYQPVEKTWWKKAITYDDLKINSPYNTYKNPGLPPAPISNPGLEAIKAVITAPDTDYLYYVSDSTGKNHYAKTLEQHNANIKRFGL